jgi:SAM-dependent methyltransferase
MIIPRLAIVRSYGHPLRATLFGQLILCNYDLKEFKKFFRLFRDGIVWKVIRYQGDHVVLARGSGRLKLKFPYAFTTVAEWERIWRPYYLPPFSLKGKTVLDVGAGYGETAFFYLEHGASKIICVEPDTKASSVLRENARSNNWDVEIVPKEFDLGILNEKFDFMKMDCEGCERQLLDIDKLPCPSVIEVHTSYLARMFMEKFGMRTLMKLNENVLLLGSSG